MNLLISLLCDLGRKQNLDIPGNLRQGSVESPTKKNRATGKPKKKKIPDIPDVLNSVNIAGRRAFLH